MTRLRSRIPLPVWGLIGIALFVIVAYLVFGGRAGFGGQSFELRAVFRSEAQLMVRSPVRIAGIDVGTVTEIEPIGDGSDAAVVTMQIDDKGLPIHADSTVKIRSRLLLEGNFYIELSPGTPAAGEMKSGDTIAAATHQRAGAARPRALRSPSADEEVAAHDPPGIRSGDRRRAGGTERRTRIRPRRVRPPASR